MYNSSFSLKGAGLGLRRDMMSSLATLHAKQIDFWEIAPENWLGIGGKYGQFFKEISDKITLVSHGLSLSLGGPAPLDVHFLRSIKKFLKQFNIRCYTEHLSYCGDFGHLYDLMPIPFTEDAVHYVAKRIRQTQDILEQKIAVENVSYYLQPSNELSEIEFINAVLTESNCGLLLDVNNVYVNSVNHRYDPMEFIKRLPSERIFYLHIAGHYQEAPDLIVDTHGADVIDPVWTLLDKTYQLFGELPTLLERDFNFPPFEVLLKEVETIGSYQKKCQPLKKISEDVIYTHR